MTVIRADSYDRQSGTLTYTLPRPSRVHVQAGVAPPALRDQAEGALMKTIVNREPRAAGKILEHWNGLDESGTIAVPDLPNFVVAIAVTALPENAIITTGNRRTTFLNSLSYRDGESVLPAHRDHAHHAWLTSTQDTAPPLRLSLDDTTGVDPHLITTSGSGVRVRATLDGQMADEFARQHGRVTAYIDGFPVATTDGVSKTVVLDVPAPPGAHILAVNWASPFGPVAANSLRIQSK